jgi:hypothetical protein
MHTTGFLLATVPVAALMPTRPMASRLIAKTAKANRRGDRFKVHQFR